MEPETLYLNAEESARALGVSIATLYAYVSRKMVRSERVEGSRSRKYWKADIDRLSGRLTPSVPGLSQAALVSESAITLITENGLFFRGHDAIALSQHASVESLAALLWQADESTLFASPVAAPPQSWSHLQTTLSALSVPERVLAVFPLIERANPRTYDLSPAGFVRTAVDVLRWYATLLVNASRPCAEPLHLYVAKALKAPSGFEETIRQLLVLAADHEFDPITYAVRATANVGVTPYQAVITGLIASQGQRFQAERSAPAMRFLEEILGSKDGHAVVVRRLRSGETLPGFGGDSSHPDPRTGAIMHSIEQVLHGDRALRRLQEAQRTALEASSSSMDFIIPALFIGHRLGLRGDELTLSGLGRLVGWIAHAMEQFHGHEFIRPRATYVGPLPPDAKSHGVGNSSHRKAKRPPKR